MKKLLTLSLFALFCAPALAEKPNFVLIFTDDQGYNDVGCFGSPNIKTPRLDQMAKEGMKFTDFYSANSVCSASRAALLTGRYPPRTTITGVLFPRNENGLPAEEVTIAELLKTQGYKTACVGKWHLGHKPDFLPTKQGFDSYYGIPYSNDMWIDPVAKLAKDITLRNDFTIEGIRAGTYKKPHCPLMRDDEVIEFPADQSTLTQRYTEEAVSFIKKNKDKPFFLYLPHTMPHIPLFVPEAFKGKSERGLYGDVIEELDWSVGKILDTIKEAGIDKKTLVVFTTDNGPWKLSNGHGGHADPLRGYKFSTYEGGHRVPTIMRWPEQIPAGKVCGEVAGTIDILPTFAALGGAQYPDGRRLDGRPIVALMTGQPNAKTPHHILCYYKGSRLEAVRMGDWKLRVTKGRKKKGEKGPAKEAIELYNLADDIGESKNLAEENPEKVVEMRKAMIAYDDGLKKGK